MKHLGLAILLVSLSACSSWFPVKSDRNEPPPEPTQLEKEAKANDANIPVPTIELSDSKALTDDIASPMIIEPSEAVDVTLNKPSYLDQKYSENPEEKIAEESLPGTITVRAATKSNSAEPEKALKWLKNGNKRFLKPALRSDGQAMKDIKRLSEKESPHTFIFTTSDSRVSPEIIFDQKLGEIFVARNLGLTVDTSVLNSADYATGELGIRLVVVLDRSYPGQEVDFSHADQTAQKLIDRSTILKDELAAGNVKVIPAVYNIENGKVIFGK